MGSGVVLETPLPVLFLPPDFYPQQFLPPFAGASSPPPASILNPPHSPPTTKAPMGVGAGRVSDPPPPPGTTAPAPRPHPGWPSRSGGGTPTATAWSSTGPGHSNSSLRHPSSTHRDRPPNPPTTIIATDDSAHSGTHGAIPRRADQRQRPLRVPDGQVFSFGRSPPRSPALNLGPGVMRLYSRTRV